MKKALYYLAAAFVAFVGLQACDTEPQALDLQPAYEYTDAYYKALRAYKESDHSICYLWFANYEEACPGSRFMGLPDSVDVVSLWGGIPKSDVLREEMYEMRRLKGTRLVGVKIVRLAPSNTNYYNYLTWAKDAEIPSFMEAYKAAYDETYNAAIAAGDKDDIAASKAETAGRAAGCNALRADMSANPTRTLVSGEEGADNAVYEYPEWCRYAGDNLLNEIKEYDLDGYDLDYEPEGDALSGNTFLTFVQYLSQFIGPKSPNPRTLLCVDAPGGAPGMCAPYADYSINQSYGSVPSESSFNQGDWRNDQLIFCENIGDSWKTGGVMEQIAAFQPSRGGRKGGFGAFHNQRDYAITAVGGDKETPYGHLRRAIQLQNPAVTK